MKCTARRLVHGHLPSITRRRSGALRLFTAPLAAYFRKGCPSQRHNGDVPQLAEPVRSRDSAVHPNTNRGIPTVESATGVRKLWRLGANRRAGEPRSFSIRWRHSNLGTQWPDKPATRRKQMRECLSGRVVDVRSDVCWVYRIVKLVTRRRRTHQHLAERVAGVQVDVRWVHFVGEPATRSTKSSVESLLGG